TCKRRTYHVIHPLAAKRPLRPRAAPLVHEAYLRLIGADAAVHWNSRGHFFAAAAEAMRRILIDLARRKRSQRRGAGRRRCELLDEDLQGVPISDELLDLDEALAKLAQADPQAADL